MSTLICFAVRVEARYFSCQAKNRVDLATILTGMGCRNAARVIRPAVARQRPELVVSSGFAGGLDPAIKAGSVVFDADEGFPLTPALMAAGACEGRFHCADHIVITREEKAQLWLSTGAHAVEMESRVIRSICKDHDIPSATVRVISDTAHQSLPLDFNQFLDADLHLHYAKLLWALARRPSRIRELVRLQKQVRLASQTLASTLVHVLSG